MIKKFEEDEKDKKELAAAVRQLNEEGASPVAKLGLEKTTSYEPNDDLNFKQIEGKGYLQGLIGSELESDEYDEDALVAKPEEKSEEPSDEEGREEKRKSIAMIQKFEQDEKDKKELA